MASEGGENVEAKEDEDAASKEMTLTVPQSIGFMRSKTADKHQVLGDDGMVWYCIVWYCVACNYNSCILYLSRDIYLSH